MKDLSAPVAATAESFHRIRETSFGPVVVFWSARRAEPKVLRILLSKPGRPATAMAPVLFPASTASSCPEIDDIADGIAAFLSGADRRFPIDIARLDLCSRFQQKVLQAEYAVPRGRVTSYRRIAAHIGLGEAARAVGTALAQNPFPVVIPCHRAVRSDGTLGGFQGGVAMKQALLEMEGMRFDRFNRVVSGPFFY